MTAGRRASARSVGLDGIRRSSVEGAEGDAFRIDAIRHEVAARFSSKSAGSAAIGLVAESPDCVTGGLHCDQLVRSICDDRCVDDDATRWNRRYSDRASADDLVKPTPPDALVRACLVDAAPTSGLALDVACGSGAQTLWLAQRGLDVIAVDVSTVAVDLVDENASELGLSNRVDARVWDLDAGLPDDAVDLELIVCQRFRDQRIYPLLVDGLGPSGMAIVTVRSAVGLGHTPGPFDAPKAELLTAFTRDDLELLDHCESAGSASVIVRRR